MKTKRQILSILLVLLVSVIAQAQPSAQATMQVSVRIESGMSATTSISAVALNDGEFRGQVATVTLAGAEDSEVLVTNDSKITLINGEGHEVEMPVVMRNVNGLDKPVLRFSAEGSTAGQPYKGSYHGILSTTIEYI